MYTVVQYTSFSFVKCTKQVLQKNKLGINLTSGSSILVDIFPCTFENYVHSQTTWYLPPKLQFVSLNFSLSFACRSVTPEILRYKTIGEKVWTLFLSQKID